MTRRALPTECLDLLATLQTAHFFHPAYEAHITVSGLQVLCDGRIIEWLDSIEKIESIWNELLFQAGRKCHEPSEVVNVAAS